MGRIGPSPAIGRTAVAPQDARRLLGPLPYRGKRAPGPTSASPRITPQPSLRAGLERLAATLRRLSGTGDCCTYQHRRPPRTAVRSTSVTASVRTEEEKVDWRLTAEGPPSSYEPINDEQTSRSLRGWVVRQANRWHTSLLSNKNTRSTSAQKEALHPVRASTFPLEWQLQDVRWDLRGMQATTPETRVAG